MCVSRWDKKSEGSLLVTKISKPISKDHKHKPRLYTYNVDTVHMYEMYIKSTLKNTSKNRRVITLIS